MKCLLFTLSLLMTLLITATAQQQDKPAYRLFTKEGKPVSYQKMLAAVREAEVVLFGEQHNDPIAHWLQLELAKDLHQAHGQAFALGAEMFEADVQLVLDEYLAGLVPENNFEQEARPWPNYKTDYKPLVRYARDSGVPFVASNVPRRYAAMVAAAGLQALDSLSAEAKRLMAPLPIAVDMDLPGYSRMRTMFGGNVHGNARSEHIIQAQALKDATMAHFILRQVAGGKKMLHINGAYHSDHFEGIVWYLRQQEPKLQVRTITTVWQEGLDKLAEENKGKADFVLVVPANMTKTY